MLDLYPEKAQYRTKEKIKLIFENDLYDVEQCSALLTVTWLQKTVRSYTLPELHPRMETVIEGFDTRFGGYGVTLTVFRQEELASCCYTAFDVVADSSMAVRYGFLSDFDIPKGGNNRDLDQMRKFHINMVQFYDWTYRHDQFIAATDCYQDMMGREVCLSVVKDKIACCKEYGMKAIGYGAVYASSKVFYERHKDWGLYTSCHKPFVFIDTFYIMNIAKGCPWHEHIIEQYCKAVNEIGFDGIHMDTYGFPKTAYNSSGDLIFLDQEYPGLIQDTKCALDAITADNHLIFNNVGNWPVKSVACTPQDAVYIEVWEPYKSYNHIKQIIQEAKRECRIGKPVILAAYLKPFREDTEERALVSALLLIAAIVTNGAYQLLVGEENGVLTQGYYVDYAVIRKETSNQLRIYYDYLVQYMNLFYDSELVDVSMTHIGWDNTEYSCSGLEWSPYAREGKVWITIREKPNRKLISLINLTSCTEIHWNQGKEMCQAIHEVILQIQIDKKPEGVYLCSPDYNHGTSESLPYKIYETDRGMKLECVVPELLVWTTVWIEL